jgi:predicted RNA binding protein YcfA (HicA-like mRNA interferase family)
MPYFGSISWRDLIRALQAAGFEGPFAGKRHPYMYRGKSRLILPNPHRGNISVGLLQQVLKQAGISREDWEKL